MTSRFSEIVSCDPFQFDSVLEWTELLDQKLFREITKISVKFSYNVMKSHPTFISSYVEGIFLSEAGRFTEQVSLTCTDMEAPGLITVVEASGSAASVVSFPTAGVNVSS